MPNKNVQIAKEMLNDVRRFFRDIGWLFLFLVLPACMVAGLIMFLFSLPR